ncbi:MAG: tetratricopeptide repeat protein [Muribaculaceae bacterium]
MNRLLKIALTMLIIALAMPATAQTQRSKTQKSTARKTTANADAGKSNAELGKKYFDSENYAKAIVYVKKAAAEGDLDSQVRLADMTFFGNEVEMDRETAHDMLDKAIEKGSSYAMERKGFYLVCEGMKAEGFEWMKKAADAGNCDAAIYVMNCYRTGDSEITEPNPELAAQYCKVAADGGSMEGQAYYGLYQLRGEAGVQQDKKAGLELIEKAYAKSQRNSFEKNCPEAAVELANHFKESGKSKQATEITEAVKKYHNGRY